MPSVGPSADRPSIETRADFSRKILRIHFRGVVTAADVHVHAAAVRELLAKLGPGFVLLTDLSELQEMEIESVRDLTAIMDLCLEAGVKQIVRAIPDPAKDIGFRLLSLTHYRGRVPIAICQTLAEAEQALDAQAAL